MWLADMYSEADQQDSVSHKETLKYPAYLFHLLHTKQIFFPIYNQDRFLWDNTTCILAATHPETCKAHSLLLSPLTNWSFAFFRDLIQVVPLLLEVYDSPYSFHTILFQSFPSYEAQKYQIFDDKRANSKSNLLSYLAWAELNDLRYFSLSSNACSDNESTCALSLETIFSYVCRSSCAKCLASSNSFSASVSRT